MFPQQRPGSHDLQSQTFGDFQRDLDLKDGGQGSEGGSSLGMGLAEARNLLLSMGLPDDLGAQAEKGWSNKC